MSDDLMMVGHLRPGDLFYMLGYNDRAWYTCISVTHTETKEGIPWSRGLMLTSSCKLVQFSDRSAKEICVPPGMGREWTKWDVVPYEPGT